MKISDDQYPLIEDTTGAVLLGYRPSEADPDKPETVRVPAALLGGGGGLQFAISEDESHLHIWTAGGAYKGSAVLVDLGIDDL